MVIFRKIQFFIGDREKIFMNIYQYLPVSLANKVPSTFGEG